MLECWNVNPGKRPLFAFLSERLGSMLEAEGSSKYLNLNFSYLYPVWDSESKEETGSDSGASGSVGEESCAIIDTSALTGRYICSNSLVARETAI